MTEHDGYLYSVARTLARPSDVEDYVQEAKVVIWQQVSAGRTDWGWLRRCARNRMLNLFDRETTQSRGGTGEPKTIRDTRKGVYTGTLPDEMLKDFAPGTEDTYEDPDVYRAVTRLEARQREYVYRRFWLDHGYAELNQHFKGTNTSTSIWKPVRRQLLAYLS